MLGDLYETIFREVADVRSIKKVADKYKLVECCRKTVTQSVCFYVDLLDSPIGNSKFGVLRKRFLRVLKEEETDHVADHS